MNSKIYVGNLSYDIENSDLENLFGSILPTSTVLIENPVEKRKIRFSGVDRVINNHQKVLLGSNLGTRAQSQLTRGNA